MATKKKRVLDFGFLPLSGLELFEMQIDEHCPTKIWPGLLQCFHTRKLAIRFRGHIFCFEESDIFGSVCLTLLLARSQSIYWRDSGVRIARSLLANRRCSIHKRSAMGI
jgi:hypothetical protein